MEIKFRAWNKYRQTMASWFKLKWKEDFSIFVEDYEYILMQYTGIKDKNGVEIYDGDLIKNEHGRVAKVTWHKHSGSWDSEFASEDKPPANGSGRGWYGFSTEDWKRCVEVIGNIYENPELLPD